MLHLVQTPDEGTGFAALLGDVVRSRSHPSRSDLQSELRGALAVANAKSPALQPLTSTIGDEFQGLYSNLASALEATLLVRISLLGRVDVRFGIGWGALSTYDRSRAPFEQDGPAWWSAREAIDRARAMTRQQEMPRGVRSVFVDSSSLGATRPGPDAGSVERADEEGGPPPTPSGVDLQGMINAFLLCRDEVVASMSPRDAETMLHLLEGESPSAIANLQGVTLSAVSQRAIKGGLYALRLAHEELRGALG